MSDLMLLGIIRMPGSSIAGDCAGFMQFVSAARGAADRIEADAKVIAKLRAELEAREADRRDAERYRWLRSQPNDTKAPRIDVVLWEEIDESANGGCGLRMDELDTAIDAALAQRQGEDDERMV
ncbi:hypothetical protein QZM35_17230 [Burkholderia sp. AU45274]|uniref:hypothetical protein n=1 Tax=Burkholderia sp. AU45274 TaxID=3059205 RepID=UPI00264F3E0F|nr:hypothetical protein [Burkholderia sp. AU45274]MDN7489453.1 hypothetical protein [Burkholderia sp. AU45274]